MRTVLRGLAMIEFRLSGTGGPAVVVKVGCLAMPHPPLFEKLVKTAI
jgi:hypothetical protein